MIKQKLVPFISLFFLIFHPLNSQDNQPYIDNIQFHFDEDLQAIVIRYDLLDFSELETYDVGLVFIDGKNFTVHPETVAGDVGQGVTGGVNKQIVWEIFNDIEGLAETARPELTIKAVHEIPLDPSTAAIVDKISTAEAKRYHFKIQRDGLMLLGICAGVGSVLFKLKADDYIDQQNLAPSIDEYEIAGKKANDYYALTYISGGVAAASIGLAAIQYILGGKSRSGKSAFQIVPAGSSGVALAWTRRF
jgi:hypothetical protein